MSNKTVQRISDCGEIQNAVLTPDNVLNVLIYGSLDDMRTWVGEQLQPLHMNDA